MHLAPAEHIQYVHHTLRYLDVHPEPNTADCTCTVHYTQMCIAPTTGSGTGTGVPVPVYRSHGHAGVVSCDIPARPS